MLPQCPSLASLGLGSNGFGNGEAKRLAAVLPRCPSLAYLHLAFNSIGAEGLGRLAAVLPQSPLLAHLDLSNNGTEDEGYGRLRLVAVRLHFKVALGCDHAIMPWSHRLSRHSVVSHVRLAEESYLIQGLIKDLRRQSNEGQRSDCQPGGRPPLDECSTGRHDCFCHTGCLRGLSARLRRLSAGASGMLESNTGERRFDLNVMYLDK